MHDRHTQIQFTYLLSAKKNINLWQYAGLNSKPSLSYMTTWGTVRNMLQPDWSQNSHRVGGYRTDTKLNKTRHISCLCFILPLLPAGLQLGPVHISRHSYAASTEATIIHDNCVYTYLVSRERYVHYSKL
jgi:hypothetical protein